MAMSLPGTSGNYASYGNVNPTTTTAFTIIQWFQIAASTFGMAMSSKFVINTTPTFIVGVGNVAGTNGQGLQFSVGTGNNAVATGKKDITVSLGEWHVAVFRYDGGGANNDARLRMWFDGAEQTSLTYSTTVPATTGSAGGLILGNGRSDASTGMWNGLLGPVKIYNTALTSESIQSEMYSYWPFDTANLQFFFYGQDNGLFKDYGPNAYTYTAVGTNTYSQQCPFGEPDFFRHVPRGNRRTVLTKRHEPIHNRLSSLPALPLTGLFSG